VKSSQLLGWMIALAVGFAACGRQTLDLAKVPAGGVADAASGGATGGGGASPTARMTVVVADHPDPGTVGRDCTDASVCNWWQEPDPNELCCAGVCSNTQGDPLNCGACGRACAPGEVCGSGHCAPPTVCSVMLCDAGLICCAGECVKPYNNRLDCGGCGISCRFEGASCLEGVCCPGDQPEAACRTPSCPEGLVLCASGCKNIDRDPDNCGACGAVCPASARRCVAGLCLGT
jgi:hypothetical protein